MNDKIIKDLKDENLRLFHSKFAISQLLIKYHHNLLTFRKICVCEKTKAIPIEELETQFEALLGEVSNQSSTYRQLITRTANKQKERSVPAVTPTGVRPLLPNAVPLILLPTGQLVSSVPMVTLHNQSLSKSTPNQKLPISRLKPNSSPIKRKTDVSDKANRKITQTEKQISNEEELEIVSEIMRDQEEEIQKCTESGVESDPNENQCRILGNRGIKLCLTVRERTALNYKRLKSGEISSFKDEELDLTVYTKKVWRSGQEIMKTFYKCNHDNCDYEVANKRWTARDHTLSHTGTARQTLYCCDICGNSYDKNISYLKHKYSVHKIAEKPVLNCSSCDYKTLFADRLKEHSYVHIYEKPIQCDVNGCHKYFKSQTHMRKHRFLYHVADLKCQFPGCDTKLKDYVHKHKHWKIHKNLPTTVAKLKELMRSNSYALVTHPNNDLISDIRQKFVNQENGKTEIGSRIGFKCNRDECPIVTITIESMNRHLISHTTDRPFECDLCGSKYRAKNRLKLHKNEQHFNKKRPLLCCQFTGCQFETRNKASLRKHSLIHEEVRPTFSCDVDACDKSFSSSQAMRHHKRCVHTEERPYTCEWPGCEKRFKMKATMKKHLRSHCENGIRFECHLCANDYRYKSDLNKHLKTKH